MTSDASATQEREAPLVGVAEGADEFLDGIATETSELVEGGLDEIDVAIMGIGIQQGGETRTNPATGEEFTTSDNLILQLRVDGIDGIPDTKQYFTLPPHGPEGGKRRKTSVHSKWGIFLAVLAGLGVSTNEAEGYRYQLSGINDLIGLKFHRELQEFPGIRNSTTKVHVPTVLYGFDNDLRTAANEASGGRVTLPPVELKAETEA